MMIKTKDANGVDIFIASGKITHMRQKIAEGGRIGQLNGPITEVFIDGDSILCKESAEDLRLKYDNIGT